MNRNNGMLAGMLVALTLVGVSTRPTKSSENPNTGEAKRSPSPTAPTAPGADKSVPATPCLEMAKRLRRFVTDPAVPIDSWRLPQSCYQSIESRAKTPPMQALPDVHFAIALVPDPVSTHLSLLFDRIVESTQQAVQDNNYSYDASWFPWETADKQPSDSQTADELQTIQQNQPGVMVFRKALHSSGQPYGGGLVIFLVGEQPTGGIRDEQFENALAWIARLGGLKDNEALHILGPTFSGSLPSLQRVLERSFGSGKEGRRIYVSSGTVSSMTGLRWFRNWIETNRPGSYFRSAVESDSLMVDRFCQYLANQGYGVNHIALLSEDETAFGRATRDPKAKKSEHPCDGAIDLYYPRDIASLRSAYEQQSVLSAAKPSSEGNAPSTTLRGDLSEPSTSNHDTVRTYAGQLTALAQEAILLDIVNRLSEKQIQFIVLRSTSSLDQIFLGEFLRRSYPEGRVVIDGADLLFNRGTDGKSLGGVMMLTPYPLMTGEQDWTSSLLNKRTGGYRTFGAGAAEAVYIAARELFRDPELESEVPIHDYAPPAWAVESSDDQAESQRPATWIGVIGRRRFWPLAVLNSSTMGDSALKGTLPPSLARGDGLRISQGETSPLHFPTVMWAFLLACGAWTWCYVYFCGNGSIMGSPRALAYFAPTDRRQHSALVALGSLLLAMLAVTVATASGIFSLLFGANPFRPGTHAPLAAGVIFLSFAGALIAYVRSCGIPALSASAVPLKNTKPWRGVVARIALLGLIAYCAVQGSLLLHLTRANRIPVYWRSVNLFSGVSPLLPEVLLLIGAYLWFWCGLRGLAHFGEDRPLLPKLTDLPESDAHKSRMPMFSWERAGVSTENEALPLTGEYIVRLVAIFGVTTGVSAIALQGIWVRTLGERAFGSLIFFWICLSVSVVFADGIQTWRTWNELRQLLVYLDRLPLRRTLRSLKGLAWGSIWKMSGNVFEERYRVISFQVESLRHLNNTVSDWAPDNERDCARKSTVALKASQCLTRLKDFAEWYVNLEKSKPVANLKHLRAFQEELAATAGAVMTNILLPAWEKEKTSLIFGRAQADGTAGEGGKVDIAISTDALSPQVRAAEEFFVLPYLAFIQNILGRLRTIALGSLWLFIGATLAVSSYPFDPLNVLGVIFLTVFIGFGGVTVLVYSQMSRDATLSHITNTKPGELGFDFWVKLLGFGLGPLIGLLTTLFPSITDFAFSWLQPSVAALK